MYLVLFAVLLTLLQVIVRWNLTSCLLSSPADLDADKSGYVKSYIVIQYNFHFSDDLSFAKYKLRATTIPYDIFYMFN